MSMAKSQMFFALAQNIFSGGVKTIDKPVNLCLNVSNMKKTLTENLPLQKSCQRAGGWCEPVRMGAVI